ncbi:hypothetical protein NA56DRAFT_651468 [Hyaloscypha hepaticicola]|uniref:Uncharacterized protein n=1 Tax=Hyaloscypha hepaticicola TaxID=2082293 RepID=A0A2J6PIG4_9HELO|nr:hypothetical protein NA56DRAFT_651468 [Hyaloscypha hepaticicola]
MDFRTWKCCKCGHKGNWIQIPGCEAYITTVIRKSQCFHLRCKKCNKLSGISEPEDDLEKGNKETGGKKPKGWRAWFLRSG